MNKLKLIGDSILAYMPKAKLKGIEDRFAIENIPTAYLRKIYPKFKDIPTDINIFCLGINDYFRQYYDEDFKAMTTEEIIQGLTDFIGEIKTDNNGELIVMSLLPIRATMPWETYYPVISKEIPIVNASLAQYCTENNINFLDAYSHFADENGVMREDLSDDGVHPNRDKGYPMLVELINNEIEKINQAENSMC
jgi:lysophospholipase L1-like esterase